MSKLTLFFKNHFEKMLLALSLLVLAGAVYFLLGQLEEERSKIQTWLADVRGTKPSEYVPRDHAPLNAALQKARNPKPVAIAGEHNLVNPVVWKRSGPNGPIIKLATADPILEKLSVSNITPLSLIITYERPSSGLGFQMWSSRESDPNPLLRPRRPVFVPAKPGERHSQTNLFQLREIKGSAENPEELIIELLDTNERVSISTNKPYTRVEGYKADIRFELENVNYKNKRKGETFRAGGDIYIIVDIQSSQVIIQGPNSKRFAIKATESR